MGKDHESPEPFVSNPKKSQETTPLVGGNFHPPEKYQLVKLELSSQKDRGENQKKLETTDKPPIFGGSKW